MPVKTHVPERQVEYWTSRQVESFFSNAGYDLRVFPIQQGVECYIPADFIFGSAAGNVKLFGLKYKALYHNGNDFWKLTKHQHSTLSQFDWIYYGLSDLRDTSQFQNTLHYLRVYDTDFSFKDHLPVSCMGYMRWAAFYEKLVTCDQGSEVTSRTDFRNKLESFSGVLSEQAEREVENAVDVFALETDSRRGIRISSILQDDLDFFGDEAA